MEKSTLHFFSTSAAAGMLKGTIRFRNRLSLRVVEIIDFAANSVKSQIQESISLTRREREIIDLISEGLSNKEIAQRLHIATYTVKSHVHNILEKLALSTRLQVAAFAHTQRTQESDADNMPPINE